MKLLRASRWIAPSLLAFGLFFYVMTGKNLLPGDDNGRWFVLVMLALFSLLGFMGEAL